MRVHMRGSHSENDEKLYSCYLIGIKVEQSDSKHVKCDKLEFLFKNFYLRKCEVFGSNYNLKSCNRQNIYPIASALVAFKKL